MRLDRRRCTSTTTATRSSPGRSPRERDTRVEIAGVGLHPFGRFEDRVVTDMGVDRGARRARRSRASTAATRSRPRSAAPRTAASPPATGSSARWRSTGMPIVDVEAGCASGGAALRSRRGAIRAGQYDCVLVFGIEKMPKGMIRSSFFEPWQEEAGLARDARVLRAAGAAADARVGAHEGRPRRASW